jgi:hypothetical protein
MSNVPKENDGVNLTEENLIRPESVRNSIIQTVLRSGLGERGYVKLDLPPGWEAKIEGNTLYIECWKLKGTLSIQENTEK